MSGEIPAALSKLYSPALRGILVYLFVSNSLGLLCVSMPSRDILASCKAMSGLIRCSHTHSFQMVLAWPGRPQPTIATRDRLWPVMARARIG